MLGGARRRLICSVYTRPARFVSDRPIVSFAFDDFPRSAYWAGGLILKRLGLRGTFYAAMGLMNTSNALGDQFRADDARSAAADGHELAGHTFSHVSSRSVALRLFLEDVRKGQCAIAELAGQPVSRHFAYPYGEVSLAAKQAVGKEMESCRGTYGGVNGPEVDLNLLRANPLYGGIDRLSSVRQLLEPNEKSNGWLIFYTHDVRPEPSPYGCTPELLEATVRAAMERSFKVLPVMQALAEYITQ
jgi:peptidoglycan/xylan/chitin deacetylase (PgdA/CDA1 family)